ncbi:hypothetical protein PR048_028814 [Dryococelus australis]|uniref:Uncharacterized protein n=1 Tax=Dryococelus australis TaxID=614101 RepID=A0ABQ9GBL7_9NEOP|nr:hypothetical protein PR048_028814 [Dryococelus australis]
MYLDYNNSGKHQMYDSDVTLKSPAINMTDIGCQDFRNRCPAQKRLSTTRDRAMHPFWALEDCKSIAWSHESHLQPIRADRKLESSKQGELASARWEGNIGYLQGINSMGTRGEQKQMDKKEQRRHIEDKGRKGDCKERNIAKKPEVVFVGKSKGVELKCIRSGLIYKEVF